MSNAHIVIAGNLDSKQAIKSGEKHRRMRLFTINCSHHNKATLEEYRVLVDREAVKAVKKRARVVELVFGWQRSTKRKAK